MEDVKFYKPDKRTTANVQLIKKAFREGFKQGIAFMNEGDSMNFNSWRRRAFKEFIYENNIKL